MSMLQKQGSISKEETGRNWEKIAKALRLAKKKDKENLSKPKKQIVLAEEEIDDRRKIY